MKMVIKKKKNWTDRPMTEEKIRTLGRDLVAKLLEVKHDAASAGFWRTFHALDKALKEIGWEIAYSLGDKGAAKYYSKKRSDIEL